MALSLPSQRIAGYHPKLPVALIYSKNNPKAVYDLLS